MKISDLKNNVPEILYHATYTPILKNIKINGLGGKTKKIGKTRNPELFIWLLITTKQNHMLKLLI